MTPNVTSSRGMRRGFSMLSLKRSRSVILLMALMAALIGCKAESPTAPPSGTGGGSNTSGGVTPPVGATVVLTASSTAVQVDSLVTITATVTQNGQPVANGTAVEFVTDNGTFTDVSDVHTIRTTTNGVATVVLTNSTAVTPAINLVSTQTQAADITVIVDSGNPTEARVTKTAAFTFVTTNLTPVIRTITPTSGPIDGGTRVTIIGDAFEQPAQVFFGSAQATIISINFNQIIVMSPTARETNPNGSGTVTGPVNVRVLNVNPGKD